MASRKPWLTPYHYCSNNPLNRIDPDGLFDQDFQINPVAILVTAFFDVKHSAENLLLNAFVWKPEGMKWQADYKKEDGKEVFETEIKLVPSSGKIKDGIGLALDAVNVVTFKSPADVLVSESTVTKTQTVKAIKPSLSAHKSALKKVHEKLGGSLPKNKPGKFGSPQRGTSKKGYRLDPAHPKAPEGSAETGPHINYWDYTKGKKKNAIEGAEPIE